MTKETLRAFHQKKRGQLTNGSLWRNQSSNHDTLPLIKKNMTTKIYLLLAVDTHTVRVNGIWVVIDANSWELIFGCKYILFGFIVLSLSFVWVNRHSLHLIGIHFASQPAKS